MCVCTEGQNTRKNIVRFEKNQKKSKKSEKNKKINENQKNQEKSKKSCTLFSSVFPLDLKSASRHLSLRNIYVIIPFRNTEVCVIFICDFSLSGHLSLRNIYT